MNLVFPARALWKKPVMSGELDGRQSLSPHNAVVSEEGNLSLERGSPWMTRLLDWEPPERGLLADEEPSAGSSVTR